MAGARLAQIIGGLSLAADSANGFPAEKVLRTALLAVSIGRCAGFSSEVLRDAYYVSLLRFLGCTAFAHEEAHFYGAGDDISVRNVMGFADGARPLDLVGRVLRGVGPGAGLLDRGRAVARLLGDGHAVDHHARAQCEASQRAAKLIGFGDAVKSALSQICERFDGKGAPHHLRGDALATPVRLFHVADILEIAHHRGGRELARNEARLRAGGQLDPDLAAQLIKHGDLLLAPLEAHSVWEAYLEAEPEPRAIAGEKQLDDVALAFASFADLKSTFTLGHSSGVANLAEKAGSIAGLSEDERRTLYRAALLHDIGRVAVPNSVWDKPGSLTVAEWERVRLHAYQTERVLKQTEPLRSLAPIAAADHERIDGGGYHRGVPKVLLPLGARILAAADSYHALREPRPHRPRFDANEARKTVLQEASNGGLDPEAVRFVLEAAGEARSRARTSWPSGLTDREVEVLRHVARGASNKEIAARLRLSPRTVQHHVEHIYDKIDVTSRAAAALFAIEHGILN